MHKQLKTPSTYLPRICNHCINPACVASCPVRRASHKREEDGIVLADQDCRCGWRMCISSCPYKKVFFNWESSASSMRAATRASRTACRPSVRVLRRSHPLNGIILHDADKIPGRVPARQRPGTCTRSTWTCCRSLTRAVIEQAKKGRHHRRLIPRRSRRSADLQDGRAVEDRLPAAPRVPHAADDLVRAALAGAVQIDQKAPPTEADGVIPKASAMRLPVKYLANLMTAGKGARSSTRSTA